MDAINKNLLIEVWLRLIKELAYLQDAAPKVSSGQVVNSITQRVYLLDTVCAAKTFAIEYARTKDSIWNQRSMEALKSIPILKLASGLEEQIWDVYGWHKVPASLAVTGMAFDALWDTMEITGFQFKEEYQLILLDFINTCKNRKGLFAHNSIDKQNYGVIPLNNTTAAAVYLIEYLAQRFAGLKDRLFNERVLMLSGLDNGQNKDGYWPYLYPSWARRYVSKLPLFGNLIVTKRLKRTVYHGDIMHHVMTLYFVVKYFLLNTDRRHFRIIIQGWEWVKRRFINRDSEIMINWNSEPDIYAPRYCNLRDTNAYFWILGIIPYLEELKIIGSQEAIQFINGILLHITKNLLKIDGQMPCIEPHEGHRYILRNILPMLDQGVAWKACYLSKVIKYYS